jgi:uncharacterized membrane protein
MSDQTYLILLEIYLVSGTTWLFIALLNHRVNKLAISFTKLFRPKWTEKHLQIFNIALLSVFVPLTIYSTLNLMGLPAASSR